jgi:hypothetical protein
MLDREAFRTHKHKTVRVELPELDDHVFVRSLTTRELQEAERANVEGADGIDLLYRQVLCAVCDEDGHPVFKAEDEPIVSSLPFGVVKILSEAVNEISGLNDPKN